MLRLPVKIDSKRVKARLKDGVLFINMPKTAEARPGKVQVKTLTKRGGSGVADSDGDARGERDL